MQTNPHPDPNFYSNIRDETACINKYAPVRKLSLSLFCIQVKHNRVDNVTALVKIEVILQCSKPRAPPLLALFMAIDLCASNSLII